MQILFGVLLGLLLTGLGILLVFFSLRWLFTDTVSLRVREVALVENPSSRQSSQAVSVRSLDLTGSFFDRVLNPFFRQVARLFRRFTPASMIEEHDRKLTIAGHPLHLGAREFIGLRVVFLLVGLVLAFFILQQGRETLYYVGSAGALIASLLYPEVWLNRKVRERQEAISKTLPDTLDMLAVCAAAGLGFDQSMQRVSEFWETAMAMEFGRVISEMELGFARSEALRNMVDRTDVTELSSFVSLIIQSEKLGMSVSQTLQSYAEQMRIERRFKAQEQARKLPNKMLFPLVFLIFPSLLAVILGPSIPSLVDLFSNF